MEVRSFEEQYYSLVDYILYNGERKLGRNGPTISIFSRLIEFDLSKGKFPLLTGRQIFYNGVFGELAALLRKPKHITDFEKYGCFYWKKWANPDGSINFDYGNKWLDWDGVNQLEKLINTIKTNPNSRRMIITGWDPRNIEDLDLPCCHYSYQWFVRDGKYLDMLWNQRSVDTMVGLPSDAVFAAAWNIAIANEVGLIPGKVVMCLGDIHIYGEHTDLALKFLTMPKQEQPSYKLLSKLFTKTINFEPSDIQIINYNPGARMKFELIS